MLKIRDEIEICLQSPMLKNQAEESISKSNNCCLISVGAQKYLHIRIFQAGQFDPLGTPNGNDVDHMIYAYEAFLDFQ